jgi:serine/threonine protein kinase
MTELIGKTVDRYQIVSTVGWGGMARVYKAYQASLDRYVALKVLHEHLAEDPNFVERFEQEATAVARLRHPNIVQVFDYDNQGDLYYIVMEFVEGPTLKAEIHERLKHHNDNERQIFDLDEIVRLIAYLSDAIDYAHSRGMVHRDVKPGNIMFTLEGQVMLTDFGLARMVFASEQRRASALSGTPAYMAPEQVEGSLVDERSDIYSLGVILYELFTGQVPFRADAPHTIMTMHVTDEVPSVRQLNPDVTMDTETVILKALSKDPGKRYQTAIEFSGALQEMTGVIVVHSSTGGLVSPIATMADSQEMMPVSTQAGISELTLSAISSPYRGLYAFREEDAPYFFGREVFANKLTETVRERSMAAVIGPSGSGKSSVVFAGLLPKLRKSDNWTIIQMRPGSEPFYSLAGVLTDMLEPEFDETRRTIESRQLATLLRGGQLNLSELFSRIAQLGNDHTRQLLVIDQFEELYTLCTDDKVRHLFPNSLFDAVDASRGQADYHLSLVLTLRADFMGQALTDRPFADALQDADVKLGPMTRAELGRAIESPAAKKRVVFEAGLVERILDDVGEEPGNLPLLEFALTLLWDRRSGRRLTHAAYESIGRVEGSLARYADEIYDQLGPLERERARRVFTQMVRPGEGTEDTRRLATREELGEQDWSLAQRLADARLVTTGRSPAGEETVEIVHEALIHGWGRVRQWMNSERAFRSWQERMRIAMVQWETSERDEGALLHGAPLAEAEEWLGQKIADLSESEAAYIRTSIALREKEVAEREAQRQRELVAARQLAKEQQRRAVIEHRRAEEQTRSTHRLRLSAIILAVVFLLAVVAAIVAYGQSRDAARQADARATEVQSNRGGSP